MISALRPGGLLAALLVIPLISGCATVVSPAVLPPIPRQPIRIADDPHSDIVFVLRPQALARDSLLGPIWRLAVRRVLERPSGPLRGVRFLEALEKAESLLIAMPGGKKWDTVDDAVVVLRGVPGNADPEKMVDPEGRPLWTSEDGPGPVQAYASIPSNEAVHETRVLLFVLPSRTWVIVVGEAISRWPIETLRGVDLSLAPEAAAETPPLEALLRAKPLLASVAALRSATFSRITGGLLFVRVALHRGRALGLVARLNYTDGLSAQSALGALREMSSVLQRRYPWLRLLELAAKNEDVVLRAPLGTLAEALEPQAEVGWKAP